MHQGFRCGLVRLLPQSSWHEKQLKWFLQKLSYISLIPLSLSQTGGRCHVCPPLNRPSFSLNRESPSSIREREKERESDEWLVTQRGRGSFISEMMIWWWPHFSLNRLYSHVKLLSIANMNNKNYHHHSDTNIHSTTHDINCSLPLFYSFSKTFVFIFFPFS